MTSLAIDNIVELLAVNGIALLPHDEEMSMPDYPEGSITWMECYEAENIEALAGYGAKMTASVDNKGLSITSIRNSDHIAYDANDSDGFVEQVQLVLIRFYRDL